MTVFATLHREDTIMPLLGDHLIAMIEHQIPDTPMRQQMADDLMTMSDEGNDSVDSITNYFDDLRSNVLETEDMVDVKNARKIFDSLIKK